MNENSGNVEKMTFKVYFQSLDNEAKKILRDKITPAFMAYTTFYDHLRKGNWSELELQKLEELTNQNFAR
jgi:hypothetical protein